VEDTYATKKLVRSQIVIFYYKLIVIESFLIVNFLVTHLATQYFYRLTAIEGFGKWWSFIEQATGAILYNQVLIIDEQ
jgi:hypothetical protein